MTVGINGLALAMQIALLALLVALVWLALHLRNRYLSRRR